MRSAADELSAAQSRASLSDSEIQRLSEQLRRARLATEAEAEARLAASVRVSLLEDRLVAAIGSVGDETAGADEDARRPALERLQRRIMELEAALREAQDAARTAFAAQQLAATAGSQRTPGAEAGRGLVAVSGARGATARSGAGGGGLAALEAVDRTLLVGADDFDGEDGEVDIDRLVADAASAPSGDKEDENTEAAPAFKRLSFGDGSSNVAGAATDSMADTSAPPNKPEDEEEESSRHNRAVRIFERRQTAMNQNVAHLEGNISVKQRLVEALTAKAREMERLRGFYDARLREMGGELAAAQQEREGLLRRLAAAEHLKEEERAAVTADLKARVAEADRTIRDLQARQRDLERFARIKARTDAEIRALEAEISSLRRARVAQLALIRSEKQRFGEELAARRREAAALTREGEALKTELAKARAEGERKEVALRREQDRTQLAQRRLRDAQHALVNANASLATVTKEPRSVFRGGGAGGSRETSPEGRTATVAAATGAAALERGRGVRARQEALAAVARSVRASRRRMPVFPSARPSPEKEKEKANASRRGSRHSGGAAANVDESDGEATLRAQLEAAAARIAEKDRRVEELERRLQAREKDVRL
jgi:hypothetical protein